MRVLCVCLCCAWLFACSGSNSKAGGAGVGGGGAGETVRGAGGSSGSSTGGAGKMGASNAGASNAGASGHGTGTGGTGSGGAASTAGSGGGNAGGGAQTCNGAACNMVPPGLLDPALTTNWNPGILTDGQQMLPLGADGLPVRTTVCAHPMPGDDLNAAIKACAEGQVVQLAAGTYSVSSVVTLPKGVVLRGAGSAGASNGGTTIVRTGGGSVLAIGSTQDSACGSGGYAAAVALTADATKETTTVHVGQAANQFSAGDLAVIDEADDAIVKEGDCAYFKRVDKRSLSERVEVASVDAANGTLTLSTPLHWTFRTAAPHLAQIARSNQPITRWAGIESLAIQGGTNPGYDGQMAGGIDISNAAYCWVKDVQTDDTIGGMHVAMTGTYRCVVRDSRFHNSANYGFGADCYGIVLRCGAADNLIENNIVRYMNKPILFNVSGGGNVIGYNYADNSWATPPEWQEINIDTHCAFPHMELMEGNYAPHMGASITHGNAGYLTFFRNYSSSQFASPAVFGSTSKQTGNIAALEFDAGDIGMTVVGNVLGSSASNDLGTAPVSSVYVGTGSDTPAILEIGGGKSDVAYTSLWSHANYDTVTPGIVYNPAISERTLPSSLYLAAKPAWWPAGSAWPWAGSDLTPMVGSLPAKARSDKLP